MFNSPINHAPAGSQDLEMRQEQVQWAKGADVISASALPVLTDGNYFDVTGATGITSINTTGGPGTVIKLHFDSTPTLTHHASNLVLPGGANITAAVGDEAEFVEYVTGQYRCTAWTRASGASITGLLNVVEDITPQLGGDLDANGKTISNSTSISTAKQIYTTGADQSITAAADTLVPTGSYFRITSDADYMMTSTPTIADGTDGEQLIIHNKGSFQVIFQDNSVIASNITLGRAEGIMAAGGVIILTFDSEGGTWHITSNPNSAVFGSGANASTINVRNTSGGALTAGQAVYITGYNVGQNRVTIDLADADDAAKVPAIGFVTTSLGNNTNGTVVMSGDLIGLVNTVGASVNDGVWLGTTAGSVVFTRPTTTNVVQKLGIVTRVNASGNIMVVGAGRTNDIPNNMGTLWISANELYTLATAGATFGTSEKITNDINSIYWAFDGASEEFISFEKPFPESWDLGTVKAKFFWSSATGSTAGDTVEWELQLGAQSDDDAIDAALGTAQVISDALLANSGADRQLSDATPSITVGGTPALGDIINGKISRNVGGTDDMVEDAWLYGVLIQYREKATPASAW